jgi:hypothetical protein
MVTRLSCEEVRQHVHVRRRAISHACVHAGMRRHARIRMHTKTHMCTCSLSAHSTYAFLQVCMRAYPHMFMSVYAYAQVAVPVAGLISQQWCRQFPKCGRQGACLHPTKHVCESTKTFITHCYTRYNYGMDDAQNVTALLRSA